jgi:hypothetical protein
MKLRFFKRMFVKNIILEMEDGSRRLKVLKA